MTAIANYLDIDDIERQLLDLPQAETHVFHKFENGHYIRELHMPAGCLALGHHQNFPQRNKFIKGKVEMFNLDSTTTILEAPMDFIGPAGRKAGLVLEDTVWQNIWKTDLTDVEQLETLYLTKSDAYLDMAAHQFAKISVSKTEDRNDYGNLILELGFTETQVQEQVNNPDDQIEMNLVGLTIAPSPIHGHGVFSTVHRHKGDMLGLAKLNHYRTPLGRWVNHSVKPNAEYVLHNGHIYLVLTEDVAGMSGGNLTSEITVDYRKSLDTNSRHLTDGSVVQ